MFHGLMIKSQCLSDPVSLDCELHKCFSVFIPLGGIGWLEESGVRYFLPPKLVGL